jgi:hypothetical protein
MVTTASAWLPTAQRGEFQPRPRHSADLGRHAAGRWFYLYWAIDQFGQVIDVAARTSIPVVDVNIIKSSRAGSMNEC